MSWCNAGMCFEDRRQSGKVVRGSARKKNIELQFVSIRLVAIFVNNHFEEIDFIVESDRIEAGSESFEVCNLSWLQNDRSLIFLARREFRNFECYFGELTFPLD